jgi:predicted glycoside hydrolase/deacetylase ChbG (UPF0249 family)
VTDKRFLIVNADDFGQSCGVNRGIIQARESGIVTSASLMVRWPAAQQAAQYARVNPAFGMGLHLDLGEWAYRDGEWKPLYEVVPLSDACQAAEEVQRQVAMFQSFVGRAPTHLDGHQHVHLKETVLPTVEQIAGDLRIPVRGRTASVRYCGHFYGQLAHGEPFPEGITFDRILSILDSLPDGYTELGCHPAFAGDLDTMYAYERETELAVLCHPAMRTAITERGVELCSFAALAGRT